MTAKPKKTAGKKTAQRTTKSPAKKRGPYITKVQNEAVKQLVKSLHMKHGKSLCVKEYHRAIESFIKIEICYGTTLNILIGAEIWVRKSQKNPAKLRNLLSDKRAGE